MANQVKHYSQYRHPEYQTNAKKWEYARRVYDGTAYDPENIAAFLPRKVQREPQQAYEERQKLLDPQMNFATGIESLAGVMFDSEQDADSVWQDPDKAIGLGDPSDKDSVAYRITRNADGKGTDWEFVPKRAAIKLSMYQRLWGLVDGRPKDEEGNSTGDAKVLIIDPQAVVNWYEEDGRLTWVLVEEYRDTRTSYKDSPELNKVYCEYLPEGWRRFSVDEKGNETVHGSGTYQYFGTDGRSQRILPIFSTSIPLPRNPGYLWARKSNAIQNFESRLDFAHMTITFALLQVAIRSANLEEFKKHFKEGMNFLSIDPESSRDHKFLDQNSSFFEASEKRLEKKIKDFYHNMFKDFGDAAKERTAREITMESKTGIEAYLTLLVGAVDEFENQAKWRLSQVYFPNNPDVWGDAYTKRTADFSPKDIDVVLDKLAQRYIGNRPIPLPANGLVEVIKRITSEDGINLGDASEDELTRIAQQIIDQRAVERDLSSAFGLGG